MNNKKTQANFAGNERDREEKRRGEEKEREGQTLS